MLVAMITVNILVHIVACVSLIAFMLHTRRKPCKCFHKENRQ